MEVNNICLFLCWVVSLFLWVCVANNTEFDFPQEVRNLQVYTLDVTMKVFEAYAVYMNSFELIYRHPKD